MNDHNPSELGPVFQDILWGEPRGAFDHPAGQSLLKIYRHGAGNELTDKMVHDLVRPLSIREQFGHLPPFLKTRFRGGQIRVQDLNNGWFSFPLECLAKHLLLLATTGAGKTALTIYLGLHLAFYTLTLWFIEFFKRTYRHLVPLFALLGRQLIVLQRQSLKINPLQAGPCDLRAHQAMMTDQLVYVLEVSGEVLP